MHGVHWLELCKPGKQRYNFYCICDNLGSVVWEPICASPWLLHHSVTCRLLCSKFNQLLRFPLPSIAVVDLLENNEVWLNDLGLTGSKGHVRVQWLADFHPFCWFLCFCGQWVISVIMIDDSKTHKLSAGVEVQRLYVIERRSKKILLCKRLEPTLYQQSGDKSRTWCPAMNYWWIDDNSLDTSFP